MRRKTVFIISAALYLLFSVSPFTVTEEKPSGPAFDGDRQPGKEKPYNVLLIVLDSCRADHLGYNGYQRNTSPNIDKLAKESIVFDQAIAQGNYTLPSFGSFLTSKYPPSLPTSNDRATLKYQINETVITLPQALKIYGYRTAAFPTGPYMAPTFGFSQGFDIYTNFPFDVYKTQQIVKTENLRFSMKEYFPTVLEYLDAHKNDKFFMLVHSNDMHMPYDYPPEYCNIFAGDYQGALSKIPIDGGLTNAMKKGGIIEVDKLRKNFPDLPLDFIPPDTKEIQLTKTDVDYAVARYDAGIFYADLCVGKIVNKLEEFGLMQKTILIIIADHGRTIYETHGGKTNRGGWGGETLYVTHTLYDELVKVPLIIKHPKINGRRISHQVQLVDLMPTVLGFAGIKPPAETQGINLEPLISGNNTVDLPERYAYAEAGQTERCIRTSEWKLILKDNEYEMYNLRDDPGETKNLWDENNPPAKDLKAKLEEYSKSNTQPSGKK